MELLFVYGTLKKGYSNHRCLGDAVFLGTGEVIGFDMYSNGSFPYAVFTGSNHKTIKGELYVLKNLVQTDALEGYPNHYNRTKVDVLSDDVHHTAWVYYIDEDRLPSNIKYLDEGVF